MKLQKIDQGKHPIRVRVEGIIELLCSVAFIKYYVREGSFSLK